MIDRHSPASAVIGVHDAGNHLTQGDLCFERGRVREALQHYDAVRDTVRDSSDSCELTAKIWRCGAMLGEFERAWLETDLTEKARREKREDQTRLPLHLRRVWTGASWDGKSVLVSCYHGLGDTLQFLRYVTPLRRGASRVCVQCQPTVAELVRTIDGVDEVIDLGSADFYSAKMDYPWEVQFESMELPYAFRTTLQNLPARTPYIYVRRELQRAQRNRLHEFGFDSRNFNVGLSWSSGAWNRDRDIDLQLFAPLAKIAGVKLFGLQKGPAAVQSEECRSRFQIIDGEDGATCLLDTAATIPSFDLVISVDTMMAHLAGALGQRVWTLLPFMPDWRWMIDRDDSPWYPTMRLFRQRTPGDWEGAIDRVCNELTGLVKSKAGCAFTRDNQWVPEARKPEGTESRC